MLFTIEPPVLRSKWLLSYIAGARTSGGWPSSWAASPCFSDAYGWPGARFALVRGPHHDEASWTVSSLSGPGAISLSFSATYAAAVLLGARFGALTACLGSFIAEGACDEGAPPHGPSMPVDMAMAVVGGVTGPTFEILRAKFLTQPDLECACLRAGSCRLRHRE